MAKSKKKNKVVENVRRGNGMGSIYLRKDGMWTGKIWVTNAETGERFRKTVYGHNQSEVSDCIALLCAHLLPVS